MNEQNGCFSSDNERDIRTASFTKKKKENGSTFSSVLCSDLNIGRILIGLLK